MKKLTVRELKNINGGAFGVAATIGIAVLAMAIYEHTKHFVAGLVNPYVSNE